MEHKKQHLGESGECICPKCGTVGIHKRGVPCQDMKCPECISKMIRKGSEHYYNWIKSNIYD